MKGTWILFAGDMWGCVLRICLDQAEETEGKKQGPAMPEAGGAVNFGQTLVSFLEEGSILKLHSHTWTGAFGFTFSVFVCCDTFHFHRPRMGSFYNRPLCLDGYLIRWALVGLRIFGNCPTFL